MNGTTPLSNLSQRQQRLESELAVLDTLIPLYSGLSSTVLYLTFLAVALILALRKKRFGILKYLSCDIHWEPQVDGTVTLRGFKKQRAEDVVNLATPLPNVEPLPQ
ncbi:E3 ORFB [Polar bear adenovirus 1]|uniref:E3 ORFB n=1 Tax=Polar bear adenovirus 1 TaxID=2250215 RepID=A0A345S514_9ADEN|nr:E3 ORFB [Polar bear adenovirus 1]AXI68667.1 E3 ORFB [Polar bear adenovirus 1]